MSIKLLLMNTYTKKKNMKESLSFDQAWMSLRHFGKEHWLLTIKTYKLKKIYVIIAIGTDTKFYRGKSKRDTCLVPLALRQWTDLCREPCWQPAEEARPQLSLIPFLPLQDDHQWVPWTLSFLCPGVPWDESVALHLRHGPDSVW